MDHEVSPGDAVICYSGSFYAERPAAFFSEGRRLEVSAVETEWASPSERGFKVRAGDGRHYKLVYNQHRDQWRVFPA